MSEFETALRARDQVIAVVGAAADPLLRRYATLLQDLAGRPTRVLRLDHDEIAPALRTLPASTATVFLPGLVARHTLPGKVPVVTGQHAAAITLTAATLTTLSRAGRAPQASRVVIVGADTMPTLGVLLMAAGVGDITAWQGRDSATYPLHHVTAHADAVLDLLGICSPESTPNVLTLADDARLLALPGLLRALSDVPGARADVEVFLACAFALVLATPPGDQLPGRLDHALTGQVADAAARALRGDSGRPAH